MIRQGEGTDNEASESTRLSRLLLAKSAAHAFMANKPFQHEFTVMEPEMSEMDSLSVPWDAPLISARKSSLSPEIDGSGYISPCSIYSIEADLMAEKDELFDEEDKHELARRLEQEVAGSILALWRERLNQPMMPLADIEIAYDSDDDDDYPISTGRNSPTSTSPRSPPYTQGTLSLAVPLADFRHAEKTTAVTTHSFLPGAQRGRSGSAQSESGSEDVNSALEEARRKLRKTTFDYTKDTLQRTNDVTPQQIDFRHVLKKHSTNNINSTGDF